MKSKYIKFYIIGFFILSIAFFSFENPSQKHFEIAKNLDIFATLFKEVNTNYVDEVNPNKLIKTAIDAMLGSLDPYTNYIPEDQIEDYRTIATGQYGGIGAIVGRRQEKNRVLMPYEGFPAHKSGLKIGDEIIKIDGINVSEKSTSDISKLLKGQAGTEVLITVKRYNTENEMDFSLQREKITIDNVPYYGMVDDHTGYIKLSDFTTRASKEVKSALTTLKAAGAKSIILDLRNNPGGLLDEAVNVSNIFVPKGMEIVSTKGRAKSIHNTLNSPVDTEIPLAVLINSRSASAAEIVAGVMQDYDRGVLIGRKTFGKGLVQKTRPLSYNAQLKITTAKYYIPSGRCIQAIDYSNRNEDGSIGTIPDSLKVAFTTKNGRTVFDGGGIDPDISLEVNSLSAIARSLLAKELIFTYGTEYYYSHPEIASAKEFKISDQQYAHFVDWLSDKDYDYTTKVEETIDKLAEYMEKEKCCKEVEEEVEVLRTKVQHDKESDLQKHKEEIIDLLEEELVSRYYLHKGIIEASFDNDTDILEALKVLNNAEKYNSLLVTAQ